MSERGVKLVDENGVLILIRAKYQYGRDRGTIMDKHGVYTQSKIMVEHGVPTYVIKEHQYG